MKTIKVIIHHNIHAEEHEEFTSIATCHFEKGYPSLEDFTLGRMHYRAVERTEQDLNKFFKKGRPIQFGKTYEFNRTYSEDPNGKEKSSLTVIGIREDSSDTQPMTKGNVEMILNALPYIGNKIPMEHTIEYLKNLGLTVEGNTMKLDGLVKKAIEVRSRCP